MRKKDALEDFLERHEPIAGSASIATGTILSGWRIVAFLGRGGSAEVYRVVHLSLPLQGALKLLIRNEASHMERFKRETLLLADLRHLAFPRFFGSGEIDGRPYIIMELLEPMDLPRKDGAVAAYLTAVAEGVKALHAKGIIHRDLKPQNIMRRADGSPVIIDLGLAKKYSPLSRLKMPPTLSVVDGKRVGLGTPRYAAPEQFSGGEISPAADIHALGMLADECFGGKAPLCWMRIIRRCSSSIPFLRYQSAADFITAVRRRHWLRNMLLAFVAILGVVAVGLMIVPTDRREPIAVQTPAINPAPIISEEPSIPVTVEEPDAISIWRGLAVGTITTNMIERGELVSETLGTNRFGWVEVTGRVWRNVTNEVNAIIVHLNSRTNVFDSPVLLPSGYEYWITGPGVLDTELVAQKGTTIRLKDCVFLNRARTALDIAEIRYVLRGGVYMNFSELDNPGLGIENQYIESKYDSENAAANLVRFKGPESLKALREEQDREFRRIIKEAEERELRKSIRYFNGSY